MAQLLERDGRPEEALALLRSSTNYSVGLDLPDMLIRRGRPAEALASIPTIAEERATAELREREAAERRKQDEPWAEVGEFTQEPPF